MLLGRRHHENDVRRRLFDRLEQRVERRGRQHVDFVDDEDLVAIADRGNRQAFDNHLADVVDAGVGRGVDFEHVDVAAFGNLDARVAHAAGLGRRPLHAAQRPRQDARRRRLAAAARARQHERLRDPLALERVLEGARDRLLSEHILELLRPPLAGEDLIGHSVKGRSENSARRSSTHHGNDLALLPSGPDAIRRPEIAEVPGRTLSVAPARFPRVQRAHAHSAGRAHRIRKSLSQRTWPGSGRGTALALSGKAMINFPPARRRKPSCSASPIASAC